MFALENESIVVIEGLTNTREKRRQQKEGNAADNKDEDSVFVGRVGDEIDDSR